MSAFRDAAIAAMALVWGAFGTYLFLSAPTIVASIQRPIPALSDEMDRLARLRNQWETMPLQLGKQYCFQASSVVAADGDLCPPGSWVRIRYTGPFETARTK